MNEMTRAAEGVGPYKEQERTPAVIGAEIRMYAEAGRRITLLCAIEIGRRLVEAKDMLAHGEWLPWLERETELSDRTAARYMKIFTEYGAAQQSLFGPVSNSPTLSNLSVSNALRLLAVPEEERESFAAEHDVEHLSAREVEALVRDRTAELEAQTDEAKREAASERHARELSDREREEMEKTLARMRDELREIESRPQPVAVERDEKAIEEAAAAARAEATKDLEKSVQAARMAAEAKAAKEIKALKEQVSSTASDKQLAEKELEKLRGQLKEAEAKAADEAAPYREQIRALEGRLAVASPEVAEFKAAFDRAQKELTAMLDALHKVQDGDLRAKLAVAARAVLGKFTAEVEG